VDSLSHFVVQLLHVGAWIFLIVFLLAIVGVIAIINWIVNAFRRTETAVETGVHNVGERFHHHDNPNP